MKNYLITFYTRHKVSSLLFLALFLSLLVKTINIGFTPSISRDGIFYIEFARSFLEGNYREYLNEFISFFYPFLITITSFVVDDLELAGQVVSGLAGSGMVILMYFIGKIFFNIRIGLIMAFMAALSPIFNASACKVMTDLPYALFYAWAVLAGYDLVQKPAAKGIIIFSLVAAAAYYARPEGIGIVFVIGCWMLYSCFRVVFTDAVKKCFAFSIFIILFLLLIYPRLSVIRAQTGEWTFSGKTSFMIREIPELEQNLPIKTKSSFKMFGDIKQEREAYKQSGGLVQIIVRSPGLLLEKMLVNTVSYIKSMPKAVGFGFFILMIMGIFYRKAIPFRKEQELFLLFVIIFNVMTIALFKSKYRHLISVVPFLYIWCAIGLEEMQSVLKNRKGLMSVLVLIIFLAVLPQTFRPVSKNGYSWRSSPEKTAGKWIRKNIPSGADCISWSGNKTFFYAGMKGYFNIDQGASCVRIMEIAQKNNHKYLIINNDPRTKSIREKGADFFKQVKQRADMKLVYKASQPLVKDEILIYRLFTRGASKESAAPE